MIRITKEADYGIVLLSHFAKAQSGTLFTARDLSEVTRLPLPMVSKILKILARSRLLTSHRGVKGGYILRKPPEKVTVSQIIIALEGPIGLTSCCVDENPDTCCARETFCASKGHWWWITQAIVSALNKVTLAEMIQPPSQFAPFSIRIDLNGTDSSDSENITDKRTSNQSDQVDIEEIRQTF